MRRLKDGLHSLYRSVLDDWMWVRIVFAFSCVAAAYVIWLVAFERACPKRQDIAPIATLTIAVFGAVQVFLHWIAVPDPTIERGKLVPVKDKFGILHINVWNYDVPSWLRPLVSRTAPEGCQVRIRYLREKDVALGWLLGRWNENLEPLDYAKGQIDIKLMLQNRRLPKLFPIDRLSEFAEPYEVAFAVKEDSVAEFHHFNDEAYLRGEGWKNQSWALPIGAYTVEVVITGYGLIRAARASFRLRNGSTSLKDFGWLD